MQEIVDTLVSAIKERKPQDRELLSEFIDAVANRSIPNEQAITWLKAVHENSISPEDTAFLTQKMMHSGSVLEWPDYQNIVVDKHSTGGVGDKMSLILAPLLACCGLKVPMLAGRGLGHTGGTIDKLESLTGFRTDLTPEEMAASLETVGCCISAQSSEIAPADSLLYALRDISHTIDSIPLITASIISKKAAEGLDCLVLDVKCGDAAFMKSQDDAKALASSMQQVAQLLGIDCIAQITEMSNPIGDYIGNSLEVIESILVMKCEQENTDCKDIVYLQALDLLKLSGLYNDDQTILSKMEKEMKSGNVIRKFKEMCVNQGVKESYIDNVISNPDVLLGDDYLEIKATNSGYVENINAMELAKVARKHKAGRFVFGEEINQYSGYILHKSVGSKVESGEALLTMYYDYKPTLEEVSIIENSFRLSEIEPQKTDSRLIARIGAKQLLD